MDPVWVSERVALYSGASSFIIVYRHTSASSYASPFTHLSFLGSRSPTETDKYVSHKRTGYESERCDVPAGIGRLYSSFVPFAPLPIFIHTSHPSHCVTRAFSTAPIPPTCRPRGSWATRPCLRDAEQTTMCIVDVSLYLMLYEIMSVDEVRRGIPPW